MATTTQRPGQQNSQNQRNNQNPGRQQADNQSQNNPSQSSQPHNGPVESFRLNNVSISIFENESERDGQTSRYYRGKIDKRYRDPKSGEWKSTTSFSVDELLRLQHLINSAVEFMAQKPGEQNGD